MKISKKAVKATLGLVLIGSAVFAQSLNDAKKALDAEQYQKAKSILKGLTTSQPTNAENYFYLGNVYLKTDYADSAKMAFNKGVTAAATSPLSYIGLGAVELQNNNPSGAKSNFDKAISMADKKDYRPYLFIGKAYTAAPKPDYTTALTYLEKAKAMNQKDAEVFLALGDAYRGVKKNSEAYSAYRTAFDLNKNLLRSKIELGVINKMSKAFPESAAEFNSVIALDANYGPAYRELAETYYRWADAEPKSYDEKIKQALDYYKKYLDLTDRSLDSRMRYADFLILAKDYKTLEQEAQAMAQMDKANLRILRYLGYSAFENGNYPASTQALKDFIAKAPNRVIGKDYLYLGRAQMKAGAPQDAIVNLKKAVQLDSTNAEVMGEVGKALYTSKQYADAAEAYSIAVTGPKSTPYDYYYLGSSYYFDYATKKSANQNPSKDILVKADSAFSYVLQKAPTTDVAWQFRGRIARLMDDENDGGGLAVPYYSKYIEVVTVTKPELAAKSKSGLIEAYTYLGSVAARKEKDNAKAKSYFDKVLALDPSNAVANQAIKAIGGSK